MSNIINMDEYRNNPMKLLPHEVLIEASKAGLALWTWAAQYCPDGDFDGMTEDDIEDLAGWNGEQGQLISILLNMKVLGKTEEGYCLLGMQNEY